MNCVLTDKTAAPLPRLEGVVLTGFPDRIDAAWDNTDSYPEQTVRLLYRLADNTDVFTAVTDVSRDGGQSSTGSGLTNGVEYTIWMRPETPLHYGEWQAFVGVTEDGWISGVEALVHDGELIYHGAELVVVPKT